MLTAAAAALDSGRRPWLGDGQVARLRRAETRYARHAEHRPAGAPAEPVAALLELLEHRPAHISHPLAWAAAQLDLLSKRMRRQATRPADPAVLEATRRRAQRRRTRRFTTPVPPRGGAPENASRRSTKPSSALPGTSPNTG